MLYSLYLVLVAGCGVATKFYSVGQCLVANRIGRLCQPHRQQHQVETAGMKTLDHTPSQQIDMTERRKR